MSKQVFNGLFYLLITILILFARSAVASPPAVFLTSKSAFIIHHKKDSTHQSFIKRAKAYKELDLIDVVNLILKKKLVASSDSAPKRGKLHFGFVGAPGYTQSTGLIGVISGNFAFYLKDTTNRNQSSVGLEASYTQYNQFLFNMIPNIWTKGDRWNLRGDNRLMKYPQNTFGLGGNTPNSNIYVLDYFLIRGHEMALRHIISDLYVGLGYDFDYHFKINERTTDTATDYKKYGGGSSSITSGPKVTIEFDSRRNSINPQGGFYAGVVYGYYLKYLGSSYNYGSLKVDLRTYIPLSKNKKHILALWNYYWLTFNGHAPYLDMPSTAWDDNSGTGRGYPQSRFRGKNMLYLETEYRFPILRDGLFGGVIFANVQSFTDYPSNRFTTAQPGWGLGLRVKLNKHSGTNLCFDYGFGLHGSNGLNISIGELF